MIVAIDGPAGSGKSSTAKAVARRLGYRHLDSGAFYRALTLALLRSGIPAGDWAALGRNALNELGVHGVPAADGFHLCIGDEDVSSAIRGDDVNRHVSAVARVPAVRDWLLGRLRQAAEGVDLVADGRDIGTVVFPDADVKFFLVADPSERARRRLRERGVDAPGRDAVRAETERLLARDRQDTEREVAPLRKAPDAVEIDTTALDFVDQVEQITSLVRRAQPNGPA